MQLLIKPQSRSTRQSRRTCLQVSLSVIPLILCTALSAPAQQPPSGALQTPGGVAAQPVIVGGSIRVLNSYAFRTGINELKAKVDVLNKEFDPANREITRLQDQITALETEISNQGPALSAITLADKNSRLTGLKRRYERLTEDTERKANERWTEETGPAYQRIEQFMVSFFSARGIVVVFDLAGALDKNIVQYIAPGADVTQEFMDAYNKWAASQPPAMPAAPKRP